MLQKFVDSQARVGISRDDSGLQNLNNWFRTELELDRENSGLSNFTAEWYSLVIDLGLYLGESAIMRNSDLTWEFFTWGRNNVSFQRHVIMHKDPEKFRLRLNFDFERNVAGYAYALMQGSPVQTDEFLQWVRIAERGLDGS